MKKTITKKALALSTLVMVFFIPSLAVAEEIPAFEVNMGSNFTVSSNTFTHFRDTTAFDTKVYDTTNSFNTASSTYIVPQDGMYWFSLKLLCAQSSRWCRGYIQKNWISIRTNLGYADNQPFNGESQMEVNVITYAQKGDIIGTAVQTNGTRITANSIYTNWMGTFLYSTSTMTEIASTTADFVNSFKLGAGLALAIWVMCFIVMAIHASRRPRR